MIYSLIAVVFILTTVKAGCGIANIDCPSKTSCKSGICQPDDIPDIDIPDIDIPDISSFTVCNNDTDCVSNELFGDGSTCIKEETTGINICTPTVSIEDVPTCSADIDCSDPLPVCNTIIGICIALPPIDISCESDTDCQDPLPTCETESGQCYLGCESSADCVNNTLCATSDDIAAGGCNCEPDRILGQFNICTPSISCSSNSDCNVLASVCNDQGQCESCGNDSDCNDLDVCSDYGCICQIGGICNPISISIPDSFNICSPSDNDCDDLYSCQSIPGISDTTDAGVCILDALSICLDQSDCDQGWMCSSSLSGQNSFVPSICYIDCDNNKDCTDATGDEAFQCQEINLGSLTSTCLPGSLEDPTQEPTIDPTQQPTRNVDTAERVAMFCLIVVVMFSAVLM